jgi:hypothetical protein
MDSAKFIRKRSVLAAWLAVPLLLAVITEFGSAGFLGYQQIAYMRVAMLEQLIPRMKAEARHFADFIADYQTGDTSSASVEDAHLALCNTAAQLAEFTITSISVTQETADAAQGVARIRINLKGFGSGREVANFFKQLKNKDPLIYEEQIRLARSAENMNELQLEAALGKVYTARLTGEQP